MNFWFLDHPDRATAERHAIEALASQVNWLTGYTWELGGGLCLNFEVTTHGKAYSLRMSYPSTFPYSPPFVKPSDPTQRLSTHQYLDGTLCLEWGPDNWHQELTGADLVKSTFKLLDIEHPDVGNPQPAPAPSRHSLTIGQEVRGEVYRAYLEKDFKDFLSSLPQNGIGSFDYIRLYPETGTTALILSATFGDKKWTSSKVPLDLNERAFALKKSGALFRGAFDFSGFNRAIEPKEVTAILMANYPLVDIDIDANRYGINATSKTDSVMLSRGEEVRFFTKSSAPHLEEAKILADEKEGALRIDSPNFITPRTVGIIGLGSVGSKIALSLAKTGITKFVFVDDDLVFPGNLVRHSTDWTHVCQHKVDATSELIKKLGPNVTIKSFQTNLTAQESNTYLDRVLNELGACDLIVDATANPRVFNVLSAVAQTHSKPLVWCEVFAGGLGGCVARSRSGLDPTPQAMRSKFQAYAAGLPAVEGIETINYGATSPEGNITIANDADVALIAAHATRFVWDILVHPEASIFPVSMYLIGFSKGWIFQGPFDTIPLDLGPFEETPQIVSSEVAEDNRRFIATLLSQYQNETSAAA